MLGWWLLGRGGMMIAREHWSIQIKVGATSSWSTKNHAQTALVSNLIHHRRKLVT